MHHAGRPFAGIYEFEAPQLLDHDQQLPCQQDLLDFEFDHKYMMRGLIIDKKRGNILKMDRHKYVKVAFHGFRKLSREERLATYALQRVSSTLRFNTSALLGAWRLCRNRVECRECWRLSVLRANFKGAMHSVGVLLS